MPDTVSYRRHVRATITLYPIRRPVRATITLYPIGRPVRAYQGSAHTGKHCFKVTSTILT